MKCLSVSKLSDLVVCEIAVNQVKFISLVFLMYYKLKQLSKNSQ